MPFEFSEKFKFWPNSKTNVATPCGLAQVSFQTFERAFRPLKKAEIRIKTDLQMATSLLKWLNQSFIQVQNSERHKQNQETHQEMR